MPTTPIARHAVNDEGKFANTLQSHRYTARVDADVAAGFGRGLRGGPVIFVNDKRIDGVPSLELLTQYVDGALNGKDVALGKKE